MSDRYVIVRKGEEVLARLESVPGQAPRETYWQDPQDAQLTNYRFAVRYPSADAAVKGAAVFGGEARELNEAIA